MSEQKNVCGDKLEKCGPQTGYDRSGYCNTRADDGGKHLVCATMTDDFLEFTNSKGNNLHSLSKGQSWCLCEDRYMEAKRAGHAPQVLFKATNQRTHADVVCEKS